MAWRIGIDTGGTFTDAVAYNERTQEWRAEKIWSQRGDPAVSVQNVIAAFDIRIDEIDSLVYGTTVVTNALIEGKLASVALVCTEGFRDVLHIARQQRDVVFGLRPVHRDPPIVSRDLCFEVKERCDVSGTIVKPLVPEEASDVLTKIGKSAEVVAVSFLHSYLNPNNERAFATIAQQRHAFVMTSTETAPEIREYERTLSTVLNAALLPLITVFLKSLQKLGFPNERLNLFHSAGGMISMRTASRLPISLAMSGPAAGVEAASRVAAALGLSSCISLDMGGTTTDCSLILDGRPDLKMDGHIGHHRVRQPSIAVESVGAGGGSIVRLTDHGLKVGPDSAGSDPGPACYSRGGREPTIADAFAILGYFGDDRVSRSSLRIDVEAARSAFTPLAKSLGISIEETALGAIRVACAITARAIKRITMGRGVDARDCTLLAFGGVGPMIVCLLADELGITHAIVPEHSSALSALGCLTARPSFTKQQSLRISSATQELDVLHNAISDLQGSVLAELLGTDVRRADAATKVHAMMRYSGQSYEIDVPLSAKPDKKELEQRFSHRHRAVYGYDLQADWECVAIRATAFRPGVPIVSERPVATEKGPARKGTAYFGELKNVDAIFRSRTEIGPEKMHGPMIVTDEFSTMLVPPGWQACRTGHGDVELSKAD